VRLQITYVVVGLHDKLRWVVGIVRRHVLEVLERFALVNVVDGLWVSDGAHLGTWVLRKSWHSWWRSLSLNEAFSRAPTCVFPVGDSLGAAKTRTKASTTHGAFTHWQHDEISVLLHLLLDSQLELGVLLGSVALLVLVEVWSCEDELDLDVGTVVVGKNVLSQPGVSVSLVAFFSRSPGRSVQAGVMQGIQVTPRP